MRDEGDYGRLSRMRDHCDLILRTLEGQTQETFVADPNLYDATVMRLFTLGEDAGRLHEATQSLAPDIAWHQIRGLRNTIAHGYYHIAPERIWKAAREHIPALRQELDRLVGLVPRRS